MTINTNNTKKEILTFEAYQRDGKMFLHLPVSNLEPSHFTFEDENLIIHLNNNETYFIYALNERIKKHIKENNCFIVEALDQLSGKAYQIKL